jgi:hypothetical protein
LAEKNDKYATCPNPFVHTVMPQCGPINGHTTIQINGVNLGHSIKSVSVYIKPNNNRDVIQCQNLNQSYIKSTQLKCRLPAIEHKTDYAMSNIFVTLDNSNVKLNFSEFVLVRPEIIRIQPGRVFVSGGGLVKLSGFHLNCGSFRSVMFNQTVCRILNTTGELIICKLGQFNQTGLVNLRFQMDGYLFESSQIMQVLNDPKVVYVSRDRSILSGGLGLLIGSDSELDLIEDARLNLTPYYDDYAYFNETVEKVILYTYLGLFFLNHDQTGFSEIFSTHFYILGRKRMQSLKSFRVLRLGIEQKAIGIYRS